MQIGHIFRAIARTAAAISVIVAAPVLAQEEDGVTILEPNSKWVLNYGDDLCRLIRGFGEGDNSSAFYIEQYGPGDSFSMLVAGKPFKKLSRIKEVQVQFGPDEGVQTPTFFDGDFGDFGSALVFSGLSIERPGWAGLNAKDRKKYFEERAASEEKLEPISEDRKKAITWLSISDGREQNVRLALGSMKAAFAALKTCTDKLVFSWGVDPAKLGTASRELEPAESPGRWIVARDYPREMVKWGQQGLVHFRLVVGPDGKPTSCHIQQSTRPTEFDDVVCKRLIQRASFIPALDADGQPMASIYRNTVRFTMQ